MDQELSKDCSAKIRPIVFSLETPHLHWPLESVWCWQWRRRKINIEQFDPAGRIRDEVILERRVQSDRGQTERKSFLLRRQGIISILFEIAERVVFRLN